MLNRKPKSILQLTWSDIFKKIENSEIHCGVSYDCLDILLDKDGLLTVSHPERITEAISRILADIKVCCKDLQDSSFPIELKLVGPNCSSHINVGKFFLISDPSKPKLAHNFYSRLENVRVMQPEMLKSADIRTLCNFIKNELSTSKSFSFSEKIETWLKKQIKKDKIFTNSDKKIFLEIVVDILSPQKKPSYDGITHRNDMQLRRRVARLRNDVELHMNRLADPIHIAIKKFFIKGNTSTVPEYVYDTYSEMSARKARTQDLLNKAFRANEKDTNQIMEQYGIDNKLEDSMDTLLIGILFIYKDSWIKIETMPVLDLWNQLEEIAVKDI